MEGSAADATWERDVRDRDKAQARERYTLEVESNLLCSVAQLSCLAGAVCCSRLQSIYCNTF